MSEYTLFWLDGKNEIVRGPAPRVAMTLAGYGGGAARALDFYSDGDTRSEWEWDKATRKWTARRTTQEEK